MSTHTAESTAPSPPKHADGPLNVGFAISNAIVQLFRTHAGRGPTKAKTLISTDFVVVTLGDCLTALEKTLAGGGEAELVRHTRHALHSGMREEATAIVESATGRRVVAYLCDQANDPDIAVIAFVLDGDAPAGSGTHTHDSPA